MVNLRVNVIWTSCQYNTSVSGLIQEFDNFLPFSTHIFTACCKFFPCGMDGRLNFLIGNIKFLPKFFHQAIGDGILAGKREEWVHKINFPIYNGINVILNIFRIRSYNWAVVMVVRVCKFIALVRNAWVENVFHTFVDQPLYMSVSQFCRVAFRLTWDRLNTKLINASCRSRRELDRESKLIEKCEPERIVLVHI